MVGRTPPWGASATWNSCGRWLRDGPSPRARAGHATRHARSTLACAALFWATGVAGGAISKLRSVPNPPPRTCYTRRQGHAETGVRAAQSSRPHTTEIGQMPSVRKSSAICSGRLMPPGVKANIWFAAATALGSDRPSSRSRACSTHARARTHTGGSTLLGPCPAARGGGH